MGRIKKILFYILIVFLFSCKKDKPTPPVLTTTAVTGISQVTAVSGGNVTNEGGTAIVFLGVCWNTSADPTISNSKTSESGGIGAFVSNLTQLIPNTLYYVRAYATNSVGTAYGNQVSFTTSQIATATIATTTITLITPTTAVSGGNITVDNGGSVTERGVCWGITTNPSTTNNKTSDGTGIGSYISNISGLQPGTIYYVRSYAINSAGTAYGNEISFTTLAAVPTVTTTAASAITQTTATSGGNITSDGGATVTARGVCWSTSANPTTALTTKTLDGTGTGVFTSSLTGLTANTTYYVRAYATNSIGIAYGNDMTFTTTITGITGTLSDNDGNNYGTIGIGYQMWMAENLKTTKYNDGTAIPNVTVDATWAALATGAYSDYSNTPANSTTYGRLYNWYAVDNNATTKVASNGGKNICPTGWHVPTDAEWTTLTTYLGGESVAGGRLKETGITHWISPNTGATNETGFTALPGGYRDDYGSFVVVGEDGGWWSSSEFSTTKAWLRDVYSYFTNIYRNLYSKRGGLSVRCVRD